MWQCTQSQKHSQFRYCKHEQIQYFNSIQNTLIMMESHLQDVCDDVLPEKSGN